jgi:hypothetical protein
MLWRSQRRAASSVSSRFASLHFRWSVFATRWIARVNIPSGICASFAARCRPTPTPDSISSTKAAAFKKRRAGRRCGASSTTCTRRTLRRWREKPWSESQPCSDRERDSRPAVGRTPTGPQHACQATARFSTTLVQDDALQRRRIHRFP